MRSAPVKSRGVFFLYVEAGVIPTGAVLKAEGDLRFTNPQTLPCA